MDNLITFLPVAISVVTAVYLAGNFILNVSAIDKIGKVQGFELKGINVTVIGCLILYIFGGYMGYLLESESIKPSIISTFVLLGGALYLHSKDSMSWTFLGSKWIQMILYSIIPLVVGILAGPHINHVLNNYSELTDESVLHILMIGVLPLSLILMIGGYLHAVSVTEKRIKVLYSGNEELIGTFVAEDSNYVYVDDGKVHRVTKTEVVIISQE